jgi:hypothetical protein
MKHLTQIPPELPVQHLPVALRDEHHVESRAENR